MQRDLSEFAWITAFFLEKTQIVGISMVQLASIKKDFILRTVTRNRYMEWELIKFYQLRDLFGEKHVNWPQFLLQGYSKYWKVDFQSSFTPASLEI